MTPSVIEKRLLALCLKDTSSLLEVTDRKVDSTFFANPEHSLLYQLFVQYYFKFKVLLPKVALEQALLKNNYVPSVYLVLYDELATLSESVESNEVPYLIEELWNKRVGIELPSILAPVVELSEKGQHVQALEKLKEGVHRTEQRFLNQVTTDINVAQDSHQYLELYNDKIINPDKYKGLPLGLEPFDRSTGGVRKQESVLFMGEAGLGKTTLLVNIAKSAFVRGHNVAFFTIEMSSTVIALRWHACCTGLDYKAIRDAQLSPEGFRDYTQFLTDLKSKTNSFMIVDSPKGCTPNFIESKVSQLQKVMPIDLVLIDHIGLMRQDMWKGDRHAELTEMSRRLHEICRSLDTRIVTISQINREGVKSTREEGGRVQLYNVAGSWDQISNYDIAFTMTPANTDESAFGDYKDVLVSSDKMRDNAQVRFTLRMFPSKMNMAVLEGGS